MQKNVKHLHKENGIDAAVIFRIIGDLGVLSPNYFAALCNESQITNVHLTRPSRMKLDV